MKIDFNKELKNDIIFIIIFTITIIIVNGIRSSINGTFSLNIYNLMFIKNLLISIFCILFIKYFFIFLKQNDKINLFLQNNILIEGTFKYILISLLKRSINSIINKKNLFTNILFRNIAIVISCMLFINNIIKPFIPNMLPYYKTIIDLIQNIFITFMLDYIIDFKLDQPNEIGISVFRTVFEDVIEPPIKNIIHSDD